MAEPHEVSGSRDGGGTHDPPRLASPLRRLLARLVDALVVLVVVALVWLLGWVADLATPGLSWEGRDDLAVGLDVGPQIALVPLLVGMAYEVSFVAGRGRTPGKSLVGIMVVDAHGRGFPSWGASFVRWALPALLGLVPIVGWLLGALAYAALLWDGRRQGWHDKAAGTLVVTAP